MTNTAIYWIRRDLRFDDNPALHRALERHDRVLPLYIHAPDEESPWAAGEASRWWLHHTLSRLDERFRARGSRLCIRPGPSIETLMRTTRELGAACVYWNRVYDPAIRDRDTKIKLLLRENGISCESHNASVLFEPWEILTAGGTPYRVYSAFRRRCVTELCDFRPRPAPDLAVPSPDCDGLPLGALDLLPRIPWDQGLGERWTPGETAAMEKTGAFIAEEIDAYAESRDLPAVAGTSSLSPHLHFGEIGPRRLISMIHEKQGPELSPGAQTYIDEVLWRDFAHHLLFHFPETPEQPLDRRFEHFPWRETGTETLASAWQRGTTGIPLVDAGMRELWDTGWMHNRVRMVVASFLTKNLRLPWLAGARWFWDTLVDADLAANTLGWQWTAGCGADAAPYFRVFNPVRQGERFDPQGRYVRQWCPELARLPDKHIHQPWTAPAAVLSGAGVTLGKDYPRPIVDLVRTRAEALEAFATIK